MWAIVEFIANLVPSMRGLLIGALRPYTSPVTRPHGQHFSGENMSDDLTRRDFVRSTAVVGAAYALGAGCGDGEPQEQDAEALGVSRGLVTLVRAETPEAAVARGVELTGGLSFIEPGQTVMLKPNLTGPIPPPDTTSPEVLQELIRQCWAAGAGEVIVAERTWEALDTAIVFDMMRYNDGSTIRQRIEELGATCRPLDDEPWIEVSPEGAVDYDEPILIPQILSEVDHFINVPALKTHQIAVFTMTMKNLFGLVHPDTRTGQVHGDPRNDQDPDRQKRMFAQMNLAFDPTWNVMDAIISRTTGGPTPPGDTAATNMVLFGQDRVAMDAVGLAILRVVGSEPHIEDKSIWEQVQLAEAVRVGVGVAGPDEITLVGDGVDELDAIESMLREI